MHRYYFVKHIDFGVVRLTFVASSSRNDAKVIRYLLRMAYDGTNYAGWQRQPNSSTVQQVVEEVISRLWHESIKVVGCGRTDAGVHASCFYAHFDADLPRVVSFTKKANFNLPEDIRIQDCQQATPEWHARYDATQRTYRYTITFSKDPYRSKYAYYYPQCRTASLELLNEAALVLLNYDSFAPFCKTYSDTKHYRCDMKSVKWSSLEEGLELTISANRFLRGMVRLITGMCLDVAMQKITLSEVDQALRHQRPLQRAWSVPPQGLVLSQVQYHKDAESASAD